MCAKQDREWVVINPIDNLEFSIRYFLFIKVPENRGQTVVSNSVGSENGVECYFLVLLIINKKTLLIIYSY